MAIGTGHDDAPAGGTTRAPDEWTRDSRPAGSVVDDVLRVPLKGGGEMIVDADVDPAILDVSWRRYSPRNRHTSYARRSGWEDGRAKTIIAHRLIADAPEGLEVDHINGNGLDNRRANLRLATRAQNARNSRIRGAVPYKGVIVRPNSRPYFVQIWVWGEDGIRRLRRVGFFADPVEAARAYDAVARVEHGEFARLNFPDEVVTELAGATGQESCQ